MKFDLTVVIPFTPNEKLLNNTLLALESQRAVNFEVLIVANPKPARFLISKVSYSVHILQSKAGANCARNCGLNAAQSDLVVFLDADCTPHDPLFLFKYQCLMNESPHLTGGGGAYTLPIGSNIPTQAYHFLQMDWLYRGVMSSQFRTKNLLGGNLILRKSKLDESFFDPSLKFGGTEREFLFRLYLNGHLFQFWPDQEVVHESKIYFPSLARKALAQGRGATYIQEKLGDELSHDIYLKRVLPSESLNFALRFYDFFFQIGRGHSLKVATRHILEKIFHQFFSVLLITKSIQKSKDRSV